MTKLTDTFRPRADAGQLSDLVQKAWQRESDAIRAGLDDADLREALTAQLEARFPAADMAVLQRYGCTEAVEKLSVRIYQRHEGRNYGSWEKSASVTLARSVVVPSGKGSMSTPAPWYHAPELGVNERRRAEMSAAEWSEYVDQCAADAARSVPLHLVAPFDAVASARDSFNREYRQVTDWPASQKAATGRYPTWSEIADAFPVTGAYLREVLA